MSALVHPANYNCIFISYKIGLEDLVCSENTLMDTFVSKDILITTFKNSFYFSMIDDQPDTQGCYFLP